MATEEPGGRNNLVDGPIRVRLVPIPVPRCGRPGGRGTSGQQAPGGP